jgi:hypothetical protein
MDTVKSLGIEDFKNNSGVGGPEAVQLTNYLTDKAKQMIPATGKFNVVAPTDPNADGVFFGELRNITSIDSQQPSTSKDKDGNTVITTTHTRNVSVEFLYGVRSSRTGVDLGIVRKQGSESVSSNDYTNLADPLTLAKRIVDSKMRELTKDMLPTVVSENRKLMDETSKDKAVKQLMKTVLALVKNGNYEEAINQYDQIASEYGSVAARANADILRLAIASDEAASARMAQIESGRGLREKAVKNVVDSLNAKLPSGTVILVMQTSSTEQSMLNEIVDQITKTVVREDRLQIVDRSNQDLIDAEQKFQLSGNVDDNSAISIGKLLGMKYAVLFWISGASSSRMLNLRILNIETAKIDHQDSFEI